MEGFQVKVIENRRIYVEGTLSLVNQEVVLFLEKHRLFEKLH